LEVVRAAADGRRELFPKVNGDSPRVAFCLR